MNERIKELWDLSRNPSGRGHDEQKFAELIVKECANFSYRYTSNQKNVREYNEVGWDCLPGDLLNAMQEHFGVEE
jgi:hypothetical protein